MQMGLDCALGTFASRCTCGCGESRKWIQVSDPHPREPGIDLLDVKSTWIKLAQPIPHLLVVLVLGIVVFWV